MHLAELCQAFHELSFPTQASGERPPREHVRAIQAAVERGLQHDGFRADLVAGELARLDEGRRPTGLMPFHVVPELGIKLALGHWPPGEGTPIHEHTDWTVTAVVHNALEVETFDRERACHDGGFVRKHVFPAPAGRAGHIYDPCVHRPWNPTGAWSMSLHVLSPHDGKPAPDGLRLPVPTDSPALDSDHPFTGCLIALSRERGMRLLATVLDGNRDPRVPHLLATIFTRGNARTRRAAAAVSPRLGAACAHHALRADSRVANRLAVGLDVHHHDGRVELVADAPRGPLTLLRVERSAEPALRAIATERELVIGELPGALSDEDRIALIEVVQEFGLFGDAEPIEIGS